LKHDYSVSSLSEKTRMKIKEIFVYFYQNWFFTLKESLELFSREPLPSKILLFGGGSMLPDIPEILSKEQWENLTFLGKPQIKILYPGDFPEIEIKNKRLNNPQYIPSFLIFFAYAKENL